MSKMDGDARGGAALSIRAVTGVPIKFLGMGEKPDALEVFDAERVAGRILGMGDVLGLIERAEDSIDAESADRAARKLMKGRFDLEDFLQQLRPLQDILGMLPGMGRMRKQLPAEVDDKALKRIEAIVLSMTPLERRRPKLLDAKRKRRIAAGSGTSVSEVNQLLRQFQQTQQLIKQMSRGRMPQLPGMPGGIFGR
jgi:signal recognition particle subunit SRP54